MPHLVVSTPSPSGPRAAHASAPHAGEEPPALLAATGTPSPNPIVLGEAERAVIRAAVEHALRLAERDAEHPQSAEVLLPMDYRAAISFELHPAGLYRHLWVYMDTAGRLPDIASIRLIAAEFGFDLEGSIERHAWLEELAPGHHAASILEMHIGRPRSAA